MSNFDDDEYYKKINKKTKDAHYWRSTTTLMVIGLGMLFVYDQFEDRLKHMGEHYGAIAYVGLIGIALLLAEVLIPKLRCSKCNHALDRFFHQRGRGFRKRCCGNCGFLINPEVDLVYNRDPSWLTQKVSSGFFIGALILGVGLALVGKFMENDGLKIIGVFVAILPLVRHVFPSDVCKECGGPCETKSKYCETCGCQRF